MMNVKETLRREGVAGVLKAIGHKVPSALALAEECQGDFAQFWGKLPHAGYMLQLALDMGVERDLVLQTSRELIARLIAETGDCEAEVSDCMDLCEASFGETAGKHPMKASEQLREAVVRCAKYMNGVVTDPMAAAKQPEPWRPCVVTTVMMLAEATMLHVCPCGALHTREVADSLFMMAVGDATTRIAHGIKTGRIPEGQSRTGMMDWACGIMADRVREMLPVELLLAQRMQIFPGVTEDNQLVFNRRPVRGQA